MTDITVMSTLRFIPIMFTSRFSNTGRRNRVLDERHRLMNRDIFINQSTYVVGPHDVELQDGCWCGHHYKKIVRPKNNSIGSYINTRDASMWIPLVYSKIREFLGADDRVNLWISHIRDGVPDVRPDPYTNAPMINVAYIMWVLRQLPVYLPQAPVAITTYESLHMSVSSWHIETYSRLGRKKALTGGDAIRSRRLFGDYYTYAYNAMINRALSTAITGYAVRDTMYNADFDGDAMNGLHVPDDDDYDDLPDLVNVDDDW